MEKIPKEAFDLFTSIDERIDRTNKLLMEIVQALKGMPVIGAPRAVTALGVFELAEWLGWGMGFNPQALGTGIPGGAVYELAFDVPIDERWYWIMTLEGSKPSSSVALGYDFVGPNVKIHNSHLLHEGWVGQMVCPFGLKAVKEGTTITFAWANVTANVSADMDTKWNFNRFVSFAQARVGVDVAVDCACTLFFFKVYRSYFEPMDRLLEEILTP